jgi:zinc protease
VPAPRVRLALGWSLLSALGVLAAMFAVASDLTAQSPFIWPADSPPSPLPSRQVQFPAYETRMLPNGLQVVVVLHHEQPAVSARLLVRAGSAFDPQGKAGVASLVASLLDQGTTTRDAETIADTIDSMGGVLGTGAGNDLTFINVVVMKDSFGFAMELLSDVARNPAFANEEIDRQRQQSLSGMRVRYEDPDYVADTVFDRLVYGFHPYGTPGSGTPESIRGLTRADFEAFHRQYFLPNNSILAIVGDVTAAEAFETATRVFGSWAQGDIASPMMTEPPAPTRRVIVVNKPDAVQTEIRVGHIGVPRKHPDYMPLNMAIKILGGEGGNRLHRVLRTDRGLTYGAEADMVTLKRSGDVVANTDTRSETTAEALRLVVDEFSRLQRDRVNSRELADAQAYLSGSFPLTIETPEAIAMQVLNAVFYELPLDELQSYRERVNAVTPDDVLRVARDYVKPDRLSVVLVGNASAFVGQLAGMGFARFEVVDLADLDLTRADFRRADASRPVERPVALDPRAQETQSHSTP